MALIFLESFDHWSSAQGARKWTSSSVNITPGRTGNGATIRPVGNSKTLGADYLTLTAGIAFNTPNFGNSHLNFTNYLAGVTASFQHVGDGRLYGKVDGGTAFPSFPSGPPSTFVVNLGVWYYAEFSATISITNNVVANTRTLTVSYEGRINEATIISGTLSQTYSGTSPYAGTGWSQFGISGPGGGLDVLADDFYVTDGEFLGDIKIGVLYPNAPGDSTTWTPTPTAANWQNVKEHPADDDATIVSASTVGQKDLYNLDDIPPGFVGVIKGVQALWLVKKSDAGSAAVKGVWKSGSTEIDQAAGIDFIPPDGFRPSAASYLYDIDPQRSSLFTSSDWTVSEVNALQLGIKRTI